MADTDTHDGNAIPRCKHCGDPLVGTETDTCHPCEDALCTLCGAGFVEFPVGVDVEFCPRCEDEWQSWHDPELAAIAVPFESDLQASRVRFQRFRLAQDCRADGAADADAGDAPALAAPPNSAGEGHV